MLSFGSQRSRQILAGTCAGIVAVTTAVGGVVAAPPYNVVVSGSTTVCPIAQDLVSTYQSGPGDAYHHPDSQILTADGGSGGIDCPGSGTGIKNILSGKADVADASRPLKGSDVGAPAAFTTGQLDQWVVGLDGITIIINTDSGSPTDVSNINVSDLLGIYNGTITTWNQLSGGSASHAAIKPFSRTSASGTFGDFMGFIGSAAASQTCPGAGCSLGSDVQFANPDSNPGMVSAVQANTNSIAFVGFGFPFDNGALLPHLKILSLDGTTPNSTTIRAAVENLAGSNPAFGQAPVPNTVPGGLYGFGRQLFMDTIKPSAIPNCTSSSPPAVCSNAGVPNRQTNSARALAFVNEALINFGQQQVLNEGEVGLNTHNTTSDGQLFPGNPFACPTTVSNGSYCAQVIPPWDVQAERVTNIDAVTQVGIDWNKAAPSGAACGWIRSDVLCEGVVNIDAVTKIGNHWNEAWTQWVD